MLTSVDVAARAEAREAQSLASMVGLRNATTNLTRDAQDPASENLPLERTVMLASDFMRCPTNHDIQQEQGEVVPNPTIENAFCLLSTKAHECRDWSTHERGWMRAELD